MRTPPGGSLGLSLTLLAGCAQPQPDARPAGLEGATPEPAAAVDIIRPAVPLLPAPGWDFPERGPEHGLDRVNHSGSEKKLMIIDVAGQGVCAIDYDRDGDEDLYVVDGQPREAPGRGRSTLYRNRGDGHFEDVTADSGTGEDGWGFGCAVADWDNDGWPDLFVASRESDRLYRNRGDLRFEEVSSRAGLRDDYWGASASFGDYDRDGFLDLYVGNYLVSRPGDPPPAIKCSWHGLSEIACGPRPLPAEPDLLWRNRGDGTFEDVSLVSGIRDVKPAYAYAVLFADLDRDGWPDIYAANDSMPRYLFRNLGNGRFEEIGIAAGLALNAEGKAQASMGIAIGDADGDGLEELFVTNFSDDTNTYYHNEGGSWVDATREAGLAAPSWDKLAWGTFFFDADHDGNLDLFVANGHLYPAIDSTGESEYRQPAQLYRGDGRGHFQLVAAGDLSVEKRLGRGAASVDVDRDGRLDVVMVALHETPALYLNQTRAQAFVAPRLEGRDCNRDAVGAVARIALPEQAMMRRVISGASFESQSQLRLHFGLGAATAGLAMTVEWPCGRRERFSVTPGTFPDIVEGTGEEAR